MGQWMTLLDLGGAVASGDEGEGGKRRRQFGVTRRSNVRSRETGITQGPSFSVPFLCPLPQTHPLRMGQSIYPKASMYPVSTEVISSTRAP